jgi:hypothetical protein
VGQAERDSESVGGSVHSVGEGLQSQRPRPEAERRTGSAGQAAAGRAEQSSGSAGGSVHEAGEECAEGSGGRVGGSVDAADNDFEIHDVDAPNEGSSMEGEARAHGSRGSGRSVEGSEEQCAASEGAGGSGQGVGGSDFEVHDDEDAPPGENAPPERAPPEGEAAQEAATVVFNRGSGRPHGARGGKRKRGSSHSENRAKHAARDTRG